MKKFLNKIKAMKKNNKNNSTSEVQPIDVFFSCKPIKQKFNELLGDLGGEIFIESVLLICNQDKRLKLATPQSIYNSALMAATLNLPINPTLGFVYFIPFEVDGKIVCQFQIGVKGLKQLAIRSNQFFKITESEVCKGQLVNENPLIGYEFDWTVKSNEVIGYVSYFELKNGFVSRLYMSKEQIVQHALEYSNTFKSSNDFVKNKSLWATKFSAMALKTVTKLNLSRNAPLSTEMQQAIMADQSVIKNFDTFDIDYVDANHKSSELLVSPETTRLIALIDNCTTMEQLDKLQPHINEETKSHYLTKRLNTK